MTKATLLALAERVEALTGPCRETDAEIAAAVWPHNQRNPMWGQDVDAFTASLDAAMTLADPDDAVRSIYFAALSIYERMRFETGAMTVDAVARALTAEFLRVRAQAEQAHD